MYILKYSSLTDAISEARQNQTLSNNALDVKTKPQAGFFWFELLVEAKLSG